MADKLTVIGTAFGDTITGNDQDNLFRPGAGDDAIDGGDGTDTVSFSEAAGAVTLDLRSLSGTGGEATGDTYTSIERFLGSRFGDSFIGGAASHAFLGGDGLDSVRYTGSSTAVTVNLATGTGTGGNAEGDTYSSIENAFGSSFADTFIGSAEANIFNGIGGIDTISYSASVDAVTLNLEDGMGTSGDALDDLYINIENVTGGSGADTITGSSGNNVIMAGPVLTRSMAEMARIL